MRALHVIPGLDPRDGGPPSAAQNIWIALRRQQVGVTAAFAASSALDEDESQAVEALRREGVEVMIFPVSRWPGFFARWGISLRLALWLLRVVREFDLVHAHSAWSFSSLVALFAARLGGKPYLLMPHGCITEMDIAKSQNPLRHAVKRLLKRLYLGLADAVTVASGIEERDSGGAASARRPRWFVLFHPVYDERNPPPAPHPRRDERGRLRVGYLGRLDPIKNIEALIEAASRLPEVELDLSGTGADEYRSRLHALVDARGLAPRAHFHGLVGAAQRSDFFAAIDVLAMPSFYEAFGMSAAEALVHAVPVIVSETAGIGEIVRRHGCGIVVPPSAEGVRSALERLARDPGERQSLAENALRARRLELGFESYGTKLAAIYAEMVTMRRDSARRGA